MRRAAIVLGWLAGTAVAVVLGVEAVDVVTASVTDSKRPAALSPSMVSDRLAGDPGPGPAPTSPAATTATTATTRPLPPPEERTYDLVGGTVAIRFENGAATLLFATPQTGFRVERHDAGSSRVDVRFESNDHESRFEAYWDDGPQAEIEERPED